jgi:hypothetical protein
LHAATSIVPAGPEIKPPAPRGTLAGDQAERSRLLGSGSGVSQIAKRIEGTDFGQHHPVLAKILGTGAQALGTIGDVAASTLLPAAAIAMPGTSYHHAALVNKATKQVAGDEANQVHEAETGLKAAQTKEAEAKAEDQPELNEAQISHLKAETERLLHPIPTNEYTQWRQENPHAPVQDFEKLHSKPLTKEQADSMNALWAGTATKYNLPTNQFREGMPSADAAALAGSLNNIVGKAQGSQRIVIENKNAEDKGAQSVLVPIKDEQGQVTGYQLQRIKPGETIAPNAINPSGLNAGVAATRADIREHDKSYVLPAENTEKAYQMMDRAYKEYEAARAQGKELPTGAQSMLALSTHLQTTFGNVKGARVTKDMIAEHLGARSISDDMLVAVQRFTNGDRLSPAQWEAFHDLIKQSRDLSWGTAVKEAERKKIPVDFLPADLAKAGAAGGTGGVAEEYVRDPKTGKLVKK